MKSKFNKKQDIEVSKLYLGGMTAQGIADTFDVYKQSVLNSLKRSGIIRRISWQRACGENNGRYKGGVRNIKGYVHIYMPNSHLARGDGYVAQHRLVAEKKLKRKILPKEVVHHINGNKLDNSIENLVVYESNSKHLSEHAKFWNRSNNGQFV